MVNGYHTQTETDIIITVSAMASIVYIYIAMNKITVLKYITKYIHQILNKNKSTVDTTCTMI